jgi:hypothetical protein
MLEKPHISEVGSPSPTPLVPAVTEQPYTQQGEITAPGTVPYVSAPEGDTPRAYAAPRELASATAPNRPILTNDVQFTSDSTPHAEVREHVVERFNQARQAATYFGESDPTGEEAQIITDVTAGLARTGKAIGVAINTGRAAYHLFDTDEDRAYAELQATGYGPQTAASSGRYLPTGGLLWTRQPDDPRFNRTGIGHETAHAASVPFISVIETPEMWQVRESAGYRRPHIFGNSNVNGANEAVTNMATRRLYTEAGYDGPLTPSHEAASIIGHAVIQKTATILGTDVQPVEDAMLRDYFGGSDEGIDLVRQALGPDTTHRFFNLGSNLPLAAVPILSERLELPGAVRTLQQYEETGRLPFYNWQR